MLNPLNHRSLRRPITDDMRKMLDDIQRQEAGPGSEPEDLLILGTVLGPDEGRALARWAKRGAPFNPPRSP